MLVKSMTWLNKHDGQGNVIKVGDVCVRSSRNGRCEYCVFAGDVWGGKSSTGEYGRFICENGISSIKYRNVLLAFSSTSNRRPKQGVNDLIRRFYEQGK